MFGTFSQRRACCLAVGSWLALASQALAYGDKYVATSGDDGNPGTLMLPWKHISYAVGQAASGDRILVLPGTYDAVHGETFPINVYKTNQQILSYDPDEADWARIGGDVADDNVVALFTIDTRASGGISAGNRTGIVIKNLYFLGEDVEDKDGPFAFLAVADGGLAVTETCSFTSNICERSEMNVSGNAGRATVKLDAVDGDISMLISSNEIVASERGGIEIVTGADSTALAPLRRNVISVPDSETGLFGHRYSSGQISDGGTGDFTANHVLSTWSTGQSDGLVAGIEVLVPEGKGFGHTHIVGNEISGCSGDGMLLSANGDSVSDPHIVLLTFSRNTFLKNGGSGFVAEFDADGEDDGMAYLSISSEGNIFAKNGDFGIEVINLGSASTGHLSMVNDTIADNGAGGIGFVELAATDLTWVTKVQNVIMYGNNGEGAQAVGLDSLLDDLESLVSYSDWQGFPGANCTHTTLASRVISCDPDFVDAASGNYHIESSSPCMDHGLENASVTAAIDIDLEGRVQDGDWPCSGGRDLVIDMGADEVPPDCP